MPCPRHRSLAGRRAGLEEQAIEELFQDGRWSELDPLVRDAWPRRAALPPAQRAHLAAAFSAHLFWTGSSGQALAVAIDELASLEEGGGLDHAFSLLRMTAMWAWMKPDGADARAFADRALELTRRTGDVESEVQARRFQILVAYGQGRDREAAIAALGENAAFARAHGVAVSELWADLYLAMVTSRLQDAESARQMSERMGGVLFWHTAKLEAMLHLMEGRPDVSAAILRRIRREVSSRTMIADWIAVREAFLRLHRGDLEEARKLLEGARAASDASSCGWWVGSDWSAARGWLAWEEGQLVEAGAHLACAGADEVIGNYWTISPGPVFLALRVDALLRLGRLDEAAAAVSGFEGFDPGRDRFMAAARAAARFRLDPSPARASDAETVAAAAPWPWLHALISCWRGEFLQDTGAAEAARRRFEAIGAQLGVRRAQAVLRGLGVRLPREEHGAGVLSPRELEVADLVAEGLSNPAIARRLYLSRPTVASHVAHILTKLGFSNRAQIAAWAAQRRAPAP